MVVAAVGFFLDSGDGSGGWLRRQMTVVMDKGDGGQLDFFRTAAVAGAVAAAGAAAAAVAVAGDYDILSEGGGSNANNDIILLSIIALSRQS